MAKKKINTNKKTISKPWLDQVISGEKYTARQIGFFFLIIGTLLYINTVKNDFSIDDSLVSRAHPNVTRGFEGIPDILTSSYMNEDGKIKGEFRPTTQISYAIEYELFGENPHISHFFNALLYGIICLLIYKLFTQIFDPKYHIYILLGVLIFTVHPIHTEVVASIKNRENILGMLFGLLACLQILRFIQFKKTLHLILAFIFLMIAMLSKIDSIIFAGFFILIGIYKKSSWKNNLLFIAGVVIIYVFYHYYKNYVINADGYRNTDVLETPLVGDARNIPNTIGLALNSLWWYLRLNLFPYPLRFYYGTGIVNIPKWSDPTVWISFIIHSVLLFFGIKGMIKRSFYGFGIMWYLAGIYLFIQIIEPVTGIIAERHAFIANIGFSMLLSYLAIQFYNWLKKKDIQYAKIARGFGIAFLVVFVLMILKRNNEWYDANTLYATDAPKLEASTFFHFEYANQFARETGIDPSDTVKYKGNLLKSVDEYRKVLSAVPDHTTSWYNMGVSYIRMGDMENGRSSFEKAYQLDSTWRAVNHLIGMTNMLLGDTATAIQFYKKELAIKPNNGMSLDAIYNIAKAQDTLQLALDIATQLEQNGLKTERVYKVLANCYYFLNIDMDKAMFYRKKVENGEFSKDENNSW